MKKFLMLAVGALFGLFLIASFVAYQMGAFKPVDIQSGERGPYTIAALPHPGPYNQIATSITGAEALLKLAGIKPGVACALYLDDPATVPEADLRSQGGFLVPADAELKPPLERIQIPKRLAVFARFKGHPAVAAMKIYPALGKWMREHAMEPAGPALEFYRPGEVETEMPVRAEEKK